MHPEQERHQPFSIGYISYFQVNSVEFFPFCYNVQQMVKVFVSNIIDFSVFHSLMNYSDGSEVIKLISAVAN